MRAVLAQEARAARAGPARRARLSARRPNEREIGGIIMTGNFTNWDGNIADIGPIYPFVGCGDADGDHSPRLLDRLAHRADPDGEPPAWTTRRATLRQGDNLQRALQAEHTLERM